MRSNSEVRIYTVTDSNNPDAAIEIKGLAVKEDEIVVSHIFLGAVDNPIRLNIEEKAATAGLPLPFKIGEQVSDSTITGYFGVISEGAYTVSDNFNAVDLSEGTPVEDINVTPTGIELTKPTTQQFAAEVLPEGAITDVTWSVTTATGISISATGLVTIASNAATGVEFTVTATSSANPSITGVATFKAK